ncbi:MAG: valine--tRNA ligase [Bacillota bacterium]|nr:valine--tRNA ligase [Bacillota bacterium]
MAGELRSVYDPKEVEEKWYKTWEENSYFHADVEDERETFCITIPPPNVTGQLHMGHALDETMQDILTRYKRMCGYNTLWVPGTDHAGIATQAKVEEQLRKEGTSKEELGREAFVQKTFEWKDRYHNRIVQQLKGLGVSCDWERERFTLDEGLSRAVREAFVTYYEKKLIYRDKYIVNWCPHCHTTISDIEVEHKEEEGRLWEIKYQIKGEEGVYLTVATTRPETMLGDSALAVDPADERYASYVGKTAIIPIIGREIPVIADNYVDKAFGTGVVKITPFHDPNDFEVGLRHNLPQIEVIDLDAKMTEAAGKYAGMDRYECRKALLQDLKDLDLGGKEEVHVHAVGKCYRCDTTIEPLISRQWFLKMEPLAKPAIEAVIKGDTSFVPSRFDKVYLGWMENIRDWCISRQLWWGHRIPVWYCQDCGAEICRREDPCECPECHSKNLKQDEDVLDTWFSSALWPFSTLGWPDNTPELKKYFPTSVLVTGWDIIFFWVARMIFSSLSLTNEAPFKEVLIHGLVLDKDGRKMSKSLGNGVDPLEIVDKYGADSLRFMLVTGNTPGNNIRFREERLESSRNFANKIWNASRFVLMNLEGYEEGSWDHSKLAIHDRWILAKLNEVIASTRTNLDKYEMGEASRGIYEFIWDDFCDWYLELSKNSLYKGTPRERLLTQRVLVHVLSRSLELLHPFMPFITEEIWQKLPHSGSTIMLADYPSADPSFEDEEAAADMDMLIAMIKTVRNLRAEKKIPLGQKAKLIIAAESNERKVIESSTQYLDKMAAIDQVEFISLGDEAPKGAAAGILGDVRVYMPLSGLIDVEKEKARLNKDMAGTEKEIKRLQGKLNNEGFLSKAPAEVVAGEKAKLEDYMKKLEGLKETLESLAEVE